jgi:hypothetical protein
VDQVVDCDVDEVMDQEDFYGRRIGPQSSLGSYVTEPRPRSTLLLPLGLEQRVEVMPLFAVLVQWMIQPHEPSATLRRFTSPIADRPDNWGRL